VQVFDSYYENKPYFFIMPFFQHGCIRSCFPDSPIETCTATILLSQLLEAVVHLHAHNIVHRDIKPANVLIEDIYPLKVRLADFGLAKQDYNLKTFCGTEAYTAPEVVTYKYTSSVDIWSLGVIALEYIFGLPVQEEIGALGVKQRIRLRCQHIYNSSLSLESGYLADLVRGMLQKDPKSRFTASECIEHGEQFGIWDNLQPGVNYLQDIERSSPTIVLNPTFESHTSPSLLETIIQPTPTVDISVLRTLKRPSGNSHPEAKKLTRTAG
jgi:serine/threonine protein kinase